MKTLFKGFVFGFVTFFVTISASSQGTCKKKIVIHNDTICLNFLDTLKMPNFRHLIYRHKYVVKIENINRSLFKIEGTTTQKDYNTSIPPIFSSIELPVSMFKEAQKPSPPVKQITPPVKHKKIASSCSDTIKYYNILIKKELVLFKNEVKHFNKALELNNAIKDLSNSCNLPYTKIQNESNSLLYNYIGESITDKKKLTSKLKSNIERTIIDADLEANKLDSLTADFDNKIYPFLKHRNDSIIAWLASIKTTDSEYKKAFNDILKAKDDNELIANYQDSLDSILKKVAELVVEMKKFKAENKIQELINNYNTINYYNFTYISEPIKDSSDIVKFNIKITSNRPLPCNIPNETYISETYRTKGGWKIDFSTGAFGSFGSEDFLGKNLQYVLVNDSVKRIEKNRGNRCLLSIGALAHFYKRSGSNWNTAFSLGVSTTTGFDSFNLHLGISEIIGKQNRFVVTLGTTIRESQILAKGYELDKDYPLTTLPDAVPVINVFPKFGYFLGITFNLSSSKTQ
jgi:hypothetical protein